MPHIYASMTWVIIGSGNGLSPIWCQAITWTNVNFLSIDPSGTNFSEILIKTHNFSFMKMHLKMSSVKWQPFCPGRDELTECALAYYSERARSEHLFLHVYLIFHTYCSIYPFKIVFPLKLSLHVLWMRTYQIARFLWPTWGPPGSCRSQMGPMLATGTLLSGTLCWYLQAALIARLCWIQQSAANTWPNTIQLVLNSIDTPLTNPIL